MDPVPGEEASHELVKSNLVVNRDLQPAGFLPLLGELAALLLSDGSFGGPEDDLLDAVGRQAQTPEIVAERSQPDDVIIFADDLGPEGTRQLLDRAWHLCRVLQHMLESGFQ